MTAVHKISTVKIIFFSFLSLTFSLIRFNSIFFINCQNLHDLTAVNNTSKASCSAQAQQLVNITEKRQQYISRLSSIDMPFLERENTFYLYQDRE